MKKKSVKTSDFKMDQDVTPGHPGLRNYFGYCFFKAAQKFRSLFNERLSKYGLVAPQYGIMTILSHSESLNQLGLGEHMGIDKATMVKMIDVLEDKRLVKRSEDKNDRRNKIIVITPKGRTMLEELDQLRKLTENDFFAHIDKKDRDVVERVMTLLLYRD